MKVAFRNVWRDKVYSLINILGLSVSVACCLLLSLYIFDEQLFDAHHEDYVYRVITEFHGGDGLKKLGSTSPPVAWAIKDEVPQIETVARLVNPPGVSQNLLKYEDKLFYESDGYLADSTVFQILAYEFVEGDEKTCLREANSVVLTKSVATKIFGNEPALNKIISITQGGPTGDFRVSAVVKDQERSFVTPHFFISMTSSGWAEYIRSPEISNEWAGENFVISLVRLRDGSNKKETVSIINTVFQKYGSEDMKALGLSKTLDLEAISDIYLRSEINQRPRVIYVYVIGSIAAFVLLIACINFMNLSTAKATKRANEVGLRKAIGASRKSLVQQFMGEALVIVLIAMLVSLVLIQMCLPLFNELTGKRLSLGETNLTFFAISLSSITLFTGLLAGAYPAFYLSSFQPAKVLKGKIMVSSAGNRLRKSLVVFQFITAISLASAMILITQQLSFMQSKHLGFKTDSRIVIPLRTDAAKKSYPAMASELQKSASIEKISASNYVPGLYVWSDVSIYSEGSNMDKAVMHRNNQVDYNFIELLDIKLVAGRSFTDNRQLESQNKIIVNQSGIKEMGFTADTAVGKKVYTESQGERIEFEIIGVMEDYHQVSLREKIYPLMFQLSSEPSYEYLIASVKASQFESTVSIIENVWEKLNSETPFEYSFLDANIQKQYLDDKRLSKIMTSFTTIALIISCLGLYGLSSYMAERRFKEIGVRKVLGANVLQIVRLMSVDFIKLVLIAIVISIPISWYASNRWLEGFAYRISINPLVFAYVGAGALFVALLTVSFESLKAASINPVRSLKNE